MQGSWGVDQFYAQFYAVCSGISVRCRTYRPIATAPQDQDTPLLCLIPNRLLRGWPA